MTSITMRPGVRYQMKVSFEVPHNVTLAEVKDFMEDWLQSGGGCRHPNDPLFDSLQDVKITLLRKSTNV